MHPAHREVRPVAALLVVSRRSLHRDSGRNNGPEKGPHDGATVALSAITGIEIYDLPPAHRPATEALREEDLGLLARFPGERVVFADLETADPALVNGLLSGPEKFAHAGAVMWADCTRKEQEEAAVIITEVLGRPVSVEELAGYPADLAAMVCGAGARVIDLWQGLAETAQACGATRPVFTGLAAACLLAGETMVPAVEVEEATAPLAEGVSPWSRPVVKVRAGSVLVFVIDPGAEDWPSRAEALRSCDGGWLGALVPNGSAQTVEEACPALFQRIIEADTVAGDAAAKWLLQNVSGQLPDSDVIFLPSGASAFPGAALFPYAQFAGCDLVMEMEVPANRLDLGPADGKPSLTGPVFLSAKLPGLVSVKPLPARIGWRYAVLRAARKAGLRILLRHAGASGWHSIKETA